MHEKRGPISVNSFSLNQSLKRHMIEVHEGKKENKDGTYRS